jgi:hypothetical protein
MNNYRKSQIEFTIFVGMIILIVEFIFGEYP